jgi:hypothetical protein
VSSIVRVEYSGLAASCILTADPDAKTLTALVGDAGSEAADTDLGPLGVMSLEDLTVDELVAAIDAVDTYEALVVSGDSSVSAEAILEGEHQLVGQSAALVFQPESVLSVDALVTWSVVRQYLISGGEPLDDTERLYTEGLINAVSRRANAIADRQLRSRTATITLDGPGGTIVMLPEYPVTAVAEVRIDTGRVFGSASVLGSDDYEYYDDGRLYVPAGVPHSRRSVRVTYTAGYDPVPDDLQHAAIECVAYAWKRLRSRAIGTSSITADGITTQFEIDIPMPAMRTFQSYRRRDA